MNGQVDAVKCEHLVRPHRVHLRDAHDLHDGMLGHRSRFRPGHGPPLPPPAGRCGVSVLVLGADAATEPDTPAPTMTCIPTASESLVTCVRWPSDSPTRTRNTLILLAWSRTYSVPMVPALPATGRFPPFAPPLPAVPRVAGAPAPRAALPVSLVPPRGLVSGGRTPDD